jgi:TolB-like protein/ABC-type nitrate/sulfonate/bicarbonate transport system substrate-binding protein
MFTDIVGYTSMMGKDEDLAFNLLRKNLRLQKSIIRKYNGHFLKEIGDGILASFSLATDAVRCAKAIQIAISSEGYELTIGVHTGEMVFEKDDAWGDSVNVASRIQEQGVSGSILISGTVYKDIKNQKGFNVNFVEEKQLKNVDEPVKIYKVDYQDQQKPVKIFKKENVFQNPLIYMIGGLVLASLIISFLFFYEPYKDKKDNSIAVLDVKNMTNNPEDQSFCDGLTEEIINTLASISMLNVLPSESVSKYKNSSHTSKEIAADLNVSYILTVSFNKAQNRIRLSPQLYSADENKIVWAVNNPENWISEPEDQFTFMYEVAQKVAEKLNIFLSIEEEKLIGEKELPKISTYDYYLGAYSEDREAVVNAPSKIKFLLNWIHDPTFTGEYIAFEKYWEQHGLTCDIIQGGVGINPISLVENKVVDYAIVGSDKALIAISNNMPIKIVSVDQQRNPVGWVVRSDLGINSFKDLLGREDVILGDKSGTEISSILQLILKKMNYSLYPQAVNFDFDYFLANENVMYPVYLNEEPEKAKIIYNLNITEIDPSEDINGGIKLYGNVLIVHNDKFENHLDEVLTIRDGIIYGWEFAFNNPSEAVRIVNKYVKHDEKYVKAVMQRSISFANNKYGEIVHPGHMDKNTWEKTINVLTKAGILKRPIDIESSIYLNKE